MNEIARAKRRLSKILPDMGFDKVVNCMTNHERSQWARKGYPGLQKGDQKAVAKFMTPTALLYKLTGDV